MQLFEDKTARYHIFISTSETGTGNYTLYYKNDNKYNVLPNPPDGLRLDNLYMKFNRNYINDISESFSLTYTFTENTETKLDTTYNNILIELISNLKNIFVLENTTKSLMKQLLAGVD